ncbi:MAG: hypothetical protein F6K19_44035 [Cyanothece sp. SIO1E1]|nr:hypothetical protein [Cyanothece sp. SIO1E1]
MPIEIAKATLSSRSVRAAVGNGGIRKLSTTLDPVQDPGSGNIVGTVLGLGRKLIGFVSSVVGGLVWTASSIWSWIVQASFALSVFDFNATDIQIQSRIRGNNTGLAAIWGGVLGETTGFLAGIAVGYGIGTIVPVIGGPMLARAIALRVGEEALDEFILGLRAAFGETIRVSVANFALTQYINLRRWLKRDDNNVLDFLLGADTAAALKQEWGREGAKPWAIATQIEESIESIEDINTRIFTEEFLEEAFEGFIEAGYITASTIDEAFRAQTQTAQAAQGLYRRVEITPDRRVPEEKVFLQGPQNHLYTQITNTLANHRLVHNRDLGQLVGQPVADWYRASFQRRKLTIVFRDKPTPPWRHEDGSRVREATYSIPDAQVGLTWAKIKLRAKPYVWGKFRATANLSNGRQMAVYGGSGPIAQDKLEDLLALSTAELLSLNISDIKSG